MRYYPHVRILIHQKNTTYMTHDMTTEWPRTTLTSPSRPTSTHTPRPRACSSQAAASRVCRRWCRSLSCVPFAHISLLLHFSCVPPSMHMCHVVADHLRTGPSVTPVTSRAIFVRATPSRHAHYTTIFTRGITRVINTREKTG